MSRRQKLIDRILHERQPKVTMNEIESLLEWIGFQKAKNQFGRSKSGSHRSFVLVIPYQQPVIFLCVEPHAGQKTISIADALSLKQLLESPIIKNRIEERTLERENEDSEE